MLVKGKAPKVPTATRHGLEPVVNIPEGSGARRGARNQARKGEEHEGSPA